MADKELSAFAVLALAMATPAAAAPLTYDCDTTPGHFSELSQDLPPGPVTVSGILTPHVMNIADRWAPSGIVNLESADGTELVQIVVTGSLRIDKESMSASLRVTSEGKEQKIDLGIVSLMQPLPFSLAWDPAGKVLVKLANWRREVALRPGSVAKASVSCSTGEFLFEKLAFGAR